MTHQTSKPALVGDPKYYEISEGLSDNQSLHTGNDQDTAGVTGRGNDVWPLLNVKQATDITDICFRFATDHPVDYHMAGWSDSVPSYTSTLIRRFSTFWGGAGRRQRVFPLEYLLAENSRKLFTHLNKG